MVVDDPIVLAEMIEALVPTDPTGAAERLRRLVCVVRERCAETGANTATIDAFEGLVDGLATRMASGHVRGLGGLVREVRRVLVVCSDGARPRLPAVSPPSRAALN